MKVLCICQEGNNRSVTIASRIKYLGHDVLSAGLNTNSRETLNQLYEWADRILTTNVNQYVPNRFEGKTRLWDIGPDIYPRPFNRALLQIVNDLIAEFRHDLTPDP